MQYIDAHVHVWTPDVDHYPLALGFKKEDMKPASFTPEQLFAHCKLSGVNRIVLIQMSFYGTDNSYMLDMMQLHQGTFGGVAVINWNRDRPDDQMRRLLERGVRGFRVFPGVWQGDRVQRFTDSRDWLAAPGFARMFAAAAETGQSICGLINPPDLPALDAMCRRYPDSPVVIDHLCRIGADGQVRDRDVEALCALAKHQNVYVKVSAFYALGKKQPPYLDLVPIIRRVFDSFGPQRLMWASDCPFQVDHHQYDQSVALVRDHLSFLSASDREWLLGKTAERVFF
jgi:predicted TIM-barrel fold metal-dependent hydrolase